ncbi:hypothetical protein Q3G72_013734 [Acer saccharum]|nr:hypothetical protein Q3G72_013734 [Acer saccharum]
MVTIANMDYQSSDYLKLYGMVHGALVVVDSLDQSRAKAGDHKVLRRLAAGSESRSCKEESNVFSASLLYFI